MNGTIQSEVCSPFSRIELMWIYPETKSVVLESETVMMTNLIDLGAYIVQLPLVSTCRYVQMEILEDNACGNDQKRLPGIGRAPTPLPLRH